MKLSEKGAAFSVMNKKYKESKAENTLFMYVKFGICMWFFIMSILRKEMAAKLIDK